MKQTILQANQYIKNAKVCEVATIDRMGFPSLVSLTPLTYQRSVATILFYTRFENSTVVNLANCANAAVLCFNEQDYSSVMLKGSLKIVAPISEKMRHNLTTFQKQLQYEHPIFLQFHTLSVKLRSANFSNDPTSQQVEQTR